MGVSIESLPGKEILIDILVPSSIWKLLVVILIIINIKNLPLVWHVSPAQGLIYDFLLTMVQDSSA